MSSPTTAPAPASAPAPAVGADGHPRRRQILAVLCLSLLIVVIDNTVLNTALPSLSRDLQASTSALQWIVDGYTLAFAALLIPMGALGDRYGRRGALLLGLAIFGGASALAAQSTSTGALTGFRAVMGLGAALVMPATLSILNAVFPARERAAAVGIWSATAGAGIVLGPTVAGLLLKQFSWASAFWVGVPLAAAAIAAAIRLVPALPGTRRPGQRLDVAGAAVSSLALLLLVHAIIEAPKAGWTSPWTLAGIGGGIALAGAFLAWELRTSQPLIDVRIFRHAAFSASAIAVGLTFLALFGSLFALTQYLQLVKDFSPLKAGLGAMPFAGAVLVMSPVSALLAARIGPRRVVPPGLAFMGIGLLLAARVEPGTPYAYLAVAVSIMGAGMAMVLAPSGEAMLSVLPEEQAGAGSAVNDTVQELGGTLGVAVIGSIVATGYVRDLDASGLPAALVTPARDSLAAADAVSAAAGPFGGRLHEVADAAFTSAMATGFTVAAGVAIAGALLVSWLLPRRAAHSAALPSHTSAPATAETVPAAGPLPRPEAVPAYLP